MPSSKRERQRAGRDARREAAKAAQRRAQRRRQIITIVVLFVVILGIGILINVTGDDDKGTDVAAGDKTSDKKDDGSTDKFGDTACPPADGSAERKTSFPEAPANCLDKGTDYKAVVETDLGSFTIDLAEEKAPVTVNNFVFLARYKAYEGVPFHRVIPGFVVQGGDVEKGDGTGGPGYEFADELPKQGDYKIGSVAMANSGPDTNGSQFFVVTGDQGASLPPNYSLFGEVTDGMDIVKKIEADGSESGTPATVHKIVKVTIES